MNFFKRLGQFLSKLFKSAYKTIEKIYKELSPEEQLALQRGSGIVHIINTMLEDTPEAIKEAIQKRFPDLDMYVTEQAIVEIARSLGFIDVATMDDLITWIQNKLNSLEGKVWAHASYTAASAAAIIFAPKETRFAVIVTVLTYVYHKFFKQNLDELKLIK